MRRAALLAGRLTFAVPRAHAQGGLVTWNRLDVVARLDNDGRIEVAETHEIKVQSVTVHGVFRLDTDGSKKPLKVAPVEGAVRRLVRRREVADMGQMDLSAGPPFTGEAPKPPALPGGWIHGFSVDAEGDDLA